MLANFFFDSIKLYLINNNAMRIPVFLIFLFQTIFLYAQKEVVFVSLQNESMDYYRLPRLVKCEVQGLKPQMMILDSVINDSFYFRPMVHLKNAVHFNGINKIIFKDDWGAGATSWMVIKATASATMLALTGVSLIYVEDSPALLFMLVWDYLIYKSTIAQARAIKAHKYCNKTHTLRYWRQ